jgi:hypothetical protein
MDFRLRRVGDISLVATISEKLVFCKKEPKSDRVTIMKALKVWAYGHLQEVAHARTMYDQRDHTQLQEEIASLA